MSKRSGPFWDAIEGRAPVPRAAATLGFEFISADVENGTIELAFAATEDFTNPAGNVLGAFQAAMSLSVSSCGRSGRGGSPPTDTSSGAVAR